MAWERIKSWFKKRDESQLGVVRWLEANDNPWGVPVLDIRPVALRMLSTTGDSHCAENALSYFRDDGTSFIGVAPAVSRTISGGIRFRIDRMLADGALFIPREMEHKWAIYFHRGQILFVRSWLRQVIVVAEVNADATASSAEITTLRGAFVADDEQPSYTRRVADYLLRSHALNMISPAPLPAGMDADIQGAAYWCFSCFGNRAHFATTHELVLPVPDQPLRTDSLLHMAVARGDAGAVKSQLDAGIPTDLLASNGLAPLHWSVGLDDTAMTVLLLERGSPIDVRSDEGATPLMNAVQSRSAVKVTFLLDRGADPNATDRRGFTALHRAAEMGELQIVQLLLSRGALPHPEAQGVTPRSLAEMQGQKAIVRLLSSL
jgi:ankyrin repeat protein